MESSVIILINAIDKSKTSH